jgi:hypothetical protein
MSFLPIRALEFPDWAAITIGSAVVFTILMFVGDAIYHHKKNIEHVSNKRLLLTVVMLVGACALILGSLATVFDSFKEVEETNKANFASNLHEKYEFKDILRLDSENFDSKNHDSYVNIDYPQVVEILTTDGKTVSFQVTQDKASFEPTLTDIGGEVKVEELQKK